MSTSMIKPLKWKFDWGKLTPLQRLLMGFPVLGPESRAYADLLRQLRTRSPHDLKTWDKFSRETRAASATVTRILIFNLDWPKWTIFLPEDPADIPFWSGTQDDLVFVGVLIGIEDELAIEVPDEFWASLPQINFGDAVRALVERNKARPGTRDHAE
jgi:hypothetical protein